MADDGNTAPHKVIPIQRAWNGAPRMGNSRRLVRISDNYTIPADAADKRKVDPAQLTLAINKHIGIVEANLRIKFANYTMSEADKRAIHAAVEGDPNITADSVAIKVSMATKDVIPSPDQQSAMQKFYNDNGTDEASYFRAIASPGAGRLSFAEIISLARNYSKGGSIDAANSAGGSGEYNYSSVAMANFSSNNGVLSGMTSGFYREHFQTHYGASSQGQFTATRVANVLAANEGLSGAALVARTKEVGYDTGVRLGLDTNIYAPKVANIGKKYSEQIIENKANLDKASEAQRNGDIAAQERHERAWLEKRKAIEDQARREDPAKVGDVAGVLNGGLVASMRKGWVPTTKNAGEVYKGVIESRDPEALKRFEEMRTEANKTEAGRKSLQAAQPLIDTALKAVEERKQQDKITQADKVVAQTDRVVAEKKEVVAAAAVDTNFDLSDDAPAKKAAVDPKAAPTDGAKPTQVTDAAKAAETKPDGEKPDPAKQTQVTEAKPAEAKPTQVAEAKPQPAKKPGGPSATA